MNNQEKLTQDMALAQVEHLKWLETYSEGQPSLLVAGINILPIFNYELIQFLNHAYLEERLAVK